MKAIIGSGCGTASRRKVKDPAHCHWHYWWRPPKSSFSLSLRCTPLLLLAYSPPAASSNRLISSLLSSRAIVAATAADSAVYCHGCASTGNSSSGVRKKRQGARLRISEDTQQDGFIAVATK